MVTSIFVLSVISGLFFRSLYAFYITIFALFLFIYPVITISLLLSLVVFGFLSSKGKNNAKSKQSTEHHLGSNRDINE